MTPEAQRIAIVEACKWHGEFRYELPDGRQFCVDLLNDLNAMHEAEKTLDERDKWNYGNTLALMILSKERAYFGEKQDEEPNLNGLGHFALASMGAAQRAEAFLRTLGLWKDET